MGNFKCYFKNQNGDDKLEEVCNPYEDGYDCKRIADILEGKNTALGNRNKLATKPDSMLSSVGKYTSQAFLITGKGTTI